jgi:hypothetical protein
MPGLCRLFAMSGERNPYKEEKLGRSGFAAAPLCTAAAAQATAPPGMTIGPINDLNPHLPAVPTGARAGPVGPPR